jgi:hypothetical protein
MAVMNNNAGDYRIFVGAFPTGELAERIQSVRVLNRRQICSPLAS